MHWFKVFAAVLAVGVLVDSSVVVAIVFPQAFTVLNHWYSG